jgi:lambda family phage portal protein
MNIRSSINNALDAMAYAIAPEWGARRMAVRKMFEASQDADSQFRRQRPRQSSAFESAEADRLRAGRWIGSRLSADSTLEIDLDTTRRNSRELYRNDFIGGAIDSRVEHVVGTGFTVQARVSAIPGVINDAQAEEINNQLERVYAQVAPIACRGRKRSLWAKTCLVCRNIDTDGEALVVFSDTAHAEAPVPLVVEVIDVDRLETPSSFESASNVPEARAYLITSGVPLDRAWTLCRMGVQFNARKEIVGYWIRKTHPYDTKDTDLQYELVPASRVCHIFVEWFAGQSRGLPWMTRALNRAKDGKDLSEAGIIAAQVEACFSAFVKTKTNPLDRAVGNASSTNASGQRIQDLSPGRIQYIGENEEIVFANPTKTNSVGSLAEYNNRTIAAALNWPYEMLMKDWRGVSFAGGRIVLNSAKLSVRSFQKLIAEGLLCPWWNRMVEEAVIVGAVNIDPRAYRDHRFWFNQHTWTGQRWSYALTPGEEINAKVTAIDNNLATVADTLAEDQQDLEVVFKQRTKERAMERDGKIVPSQMAIADAQSVNAQQSQLQTELVA